MATVCAMSAVMESLVRRFDAIKPHLTERQRRVWLGSEARELGSGGVGIVADAVRVSPDTVRRGRDELERLHRRGPARRSPTRQCDIMTGWQLAMKQSMI